MQKRVCDVYIFRLSFHFCMPLLVVGGGGGKETVASSIGVKGKRAPSKVGLVGRKWVAQEGTLW